MYMKMMIIFGFNEHQVNIDYEHHQWFGAGGVQGRSVTAKGTTRFFFFGHRNLISYYGKLKPCYKIRDLQNGAKYGIMCHKNRYSNMKIGLVNSDRLPANRNYYVR